MSAVVRKLLFRMAMNSLMFGGNLPSLPVTFLSMALKQFIYSNVSLVLPVTEPLAKITPAPPSAHSLTQLSHHTQAKQKTPAMNPRPAAREVSQHCSANSREAAEIQQILPLLSCYKSTQITCSTYLGVNG